MINLFALSGTINGILTSLNQIRIVTNINFLVGITVKDINDEFRHETKKSTLSFKVLC